jgi:hypothetical protein
MKSNFGKWNDKGGHKSAAYNERFGATAAVPRMQKKYKFER